MKASVVINKLLPEVQLVAWQTGGWSVAAAERASHSVGSRKSDRHDKRQYGAPQRRWRSAYNPSDLLEIFTRTITTPYTSSLRASDVFRDFRSGAFLSCDIPDKSAPSPTPSMHFHS